MSNIITTLQGDIYAVRESFEACRVDVSINFEAEAGFALQLLGNNEFLASTAMKNRQSLVDAVTNVAALGVSLNPAKRQAYLVPREGRVCLDISYMGLIDLAIQGGGIRWAQAKVVRVGETFKLGGFDRAPAHEHDPFSDDEGEMRGVYVVVKTSDGDYLTHPMRIAKVFDIRDRSAAWKAWVEKKKRCPWVTDEEEMIKKTCIKQAYKTWPRSPALDRAIHYLNTEAGEGLDFSQPDADGVVEAPVGHKPTVAMPQARSAAAKRPAAAPDVQDVDPRPASQPQGQAKPAAKPAASSDATPATQGELAWARNKVKALAADRQQQLVDLGYDVASGLTKAQFVALRQELMK